VAAVTPDPLVFLHATLDAAQAEAEAARDVDYARCGVREARGPYPAASGESDGVSRPRGNLRAEIGKDGIFLEAELQWGLIPHMARHDPAAVLRRIAADRELLADLLAERHLVNDDDCWYTCRAGTEEHDGGESCNDSERGKPCDCGRDNRVERRIRLLAEGWGWTEETTA
jgi:hypothetical protein